MSIRQRTDRQKDRPTTRLKLSQISSDDDQDHLIAPVTPCVELEPGSPPPLPPKKFSYRVAASNSGRSRLFHPTPVLPSSPSQKLPTEKADVVGRSTGTLPTRSRKHTLDALRQNSVVQKRIHEFGGNWKTRSEVSLRPPSSAVSHRATAMSLQRRARLPIKPAPHDGNAFWPMSPRRDHPSPRTDPKHSRKFGKESPLKPVRPSRIRLRKLKLHNFYRFSGFLFDLESRLTKPTSQPNLYSAFSRDVYDIVGLKSWHSADCLGLSICPSKGEHVKLPVKRPGELVIRRPRGASAFQKLLARSLVRPATIHEATFSQPEDHTSTASLTPTNSYKGTDEFTSMSLSNLLLPKKRRSSAETMLRSSSVDEANRSGSFASRSFYNLKSFFGSKSKL